LAKQARKRGASSRRTTPVEQLTLPLDESDIRLNRKVLGVYRDNRGCHAIVFRVGKRRISFVEMTRGKLIPKSLPDCRFFVLRGFERVECALDRAVKEFLNHPGGVTQTARRALLSAVRATAQLETPHA
jgi:hypothetical protein